MDKRLTDAVKLAIIEAAKKKGGKEGYRWSYLFYQQSPIINTILVHERNIIRPRFCVSKSWLFGSFWNVTQTSTHFLKVKTEQSRFSPKLQNIIWLRLRPWLRWAPSRKLFLCSGKGGLGSTKFVAFETLAWHNECFFCNQCKVSMVGKGFIQVMIKTCWNGLEVAYIRID